jgi:hypothetical protein
MTIQPCADILARAVSLFAGSTHTTPIETIPLAAVLQRIQDGTYRTDVASLRHLISTGNQKRYQLEKEKDLAFTPCCALHTRAKEVDWSEKLLSTNGLVHFDLDHLENPAAVKRQLARDRHVAFAFVSPSGQGLKIFVDIKIGWPLAQCKRADPPATVRPPPCTVCGGVERWNDQGTMRCVTCWPGEASRATSRTDGAASASDTTRGDPPCITDGDEPQMPSGSWTCGSCRCHAC